ncbi:nicotinamide riboside transporter PnuC [Sediminitomix flava]|uniref:Nicotinamide riboside transporter PnuC n=1 Tax=Sediminitomix flava TaxID=379075 RepID=A0A315ZH22_SEDFL|nr:nicotinamide riboside transporter PnuC [Sediminitomix flava]PWJ44430.1 nicotinamide mononucleotide transporter [Sediminitomix flava]
MDWVEFWESVWSTAKALQWFEVVAFATGLMSVWYERKNHIAVYPLGLISVGIFVYMGYTSALYAEMGINAYYVMMSVYGWYMWTRRDSNHAVLPITFNDFKENLISISFALLSFIALGFFLDHFTDTNVPWWDASSTAPAFVAMWLVAKRKVENWHFWILANLLAIPLYFYKGWYLSSLLYFFYLLLAIWGYFSWKKKAQEACQKLTV